MRESMLLLAESGLAAPGRYVRGGVPLLVRLGLQCAATRPVTTERQASTSSVNMVSRVHEQVHVPEHTLYRCVC